MYEDSGVVMQRSKNRPTSLQHSFILRTCSLKNYTCNNSFLLEVVLTKNFFLFYFAIFESP